MLNMHTVSSQSIMAILVNIEHRVVREKYVKDAFSLGIWMFHLLKIVTRTITVFLQRLWLEVLPSLRQF